MNAVKTIAIKTHIPTISRISASTVNVNNYIGKHSRRGISRLGSEGTDDDDQIIAVPGWDDESEDNDESQSEHDNEDSHRKPTQIDSESEAEEPQPPQNNKQIQGVKGSSSSKSSKNTAKTEKSPKKPSNKKEKEVVEEVPQNKRGKQAKKDEKPQQPKGKQKKSESESEPEQEHISETAKSIGFDSDDDVKIELVVEKSVEKPKKNKSKSSSKQQQLESVDRTAKPQQQLPKISVKKSNKKCSNKRELMDSIDKEVYMAYREAIAPFFEPIMNGKRKITIKNRFKEIDEFYDSVNTLAAKMQKEFGEDYSKHNLHIKRVDKSKSELQYIDGELTRTCKSPINGQDALKFFRMNPMKKELLAEDIEAYLMGPFINTINVLAINTKQLSLLDYDRLTTFSYFNDIDYQKPSNLDYNMPAYIKLISRLNKWSFSSVFEARSNWLCMIEDTDKERLWNDAVEGFDNYKSEDNSISENILNIWDNLLHSQYVKQYIMYGAIPNSLFGKIFKIFLETDNYKADMLTLFEGPLEPIACMFTPIHFSYRGVEYGNSNEDNKPTFDDLGKIINDPGMYDPRLCVWIKRVSQ